MEQIHLPPDVYKDLRLAAADHAVFGGLRMQLGALGRWFQRRALGSSIAASRQARPGFEHPTHLELVMDPACRKISRAERTSAQAPK
jgi:hypothetical protein